MGVQGPLSTSFYFLLCLKQQFQNEAGKERSRKLQAPCNILKDEGEPGKEKVNDEKTWSICGIVGDTS